MTTVMYATAAQYRAVVKMTDPSDDAEIAADIEAISVYLSRKLQRYFVRDEEPTTRLFEAVESSPILRVDDMAEPPALVRIDRSDNGDFDAVTDYRLLPLNAASGPEPLPWNQIRLRNGSFPRGGIVEVTTRFGWPSVPLPVERATIQLTAILRLETPRATRQISHLDETIEASPDAMSIVKRLTDSYQLVRYA